VYKNCISILYIINIVIKLDETKTERKEIHLRECVCILLNINLRMQVFMI